MTKKNSTVIIIFLITIIFFCCQTSHFKSPGAGTLKLEQKFKYIPNGKFLKGMALSYDNLFADYYWIKALMYFGDQLVKDQNYSWLYYILDLSTSLDPYFQDPYEFGGIALANEANDIEKSKILLTKGIDNVSKDHPRYWYLPFFLAYNFWYFEYDFENGAKYLQDAAQAPNSPEYLALLAARMYADASKAELAIPFLNEMIKSAPNKNQKEKLIQRKKEVLVNFHLDLLDTSVEKFYNEYGRYPNSELEIVDKGVIEKIPDEPFGGKYYYDFVTKTFSSTKTDRIKVHERRDGK